MREDYIRQASKTKKIVNIVLKILYQILVIMCLILAAVIILQRVTDSNKSIGGYRIFRVITGSMEPAYQVGEVVISKEIDPKKIKIGDDIVYLGTYGEYNGKIIMHNVVAIDKKDDGSLIFHAKGLQSSSVEDPQIAENQVYGIVKIKSPLLTFLYKLATNIYSVFVIIFVLVFNVFIAFRTPKKKKVQKLNSPKKIEVQQQIDIDEDETIDDEEFEDSDDSDEIEEIEEIEEIDDFDDEQDDDF